MVFAQNVKMTDRNKTRENNKMVIRFPRFISALDKGLDIIRVNGMLEKIIKAPFDGNTNINI